MRRGYGLLADANKSSDNLGASPRSAYSHLNFTLSAGIEYPSKWSTTNVKPSSPDKLVAFDHTSNIKKVRLVESKIHFLTENTKRHRWWFLWKTEFTFLRMTATKRVFLAPVEKRLETNQAVRLPQFKAVSGHSFLKSPWVISAGNPSQHCTTTAMKNEQSRMRCGKAQSRWKFCWQATLTATWMMCKRARFN